MNPHIEYLKQLKAHGQTVVGIDYVLNAFDPERQQTNRMPPSRRYDSTMDYLQVRELGRAYKASRSYKTH
jgi:hypothetical protein